jgi:hypothetical protein
MIPIAHASRLLAVARAVITFDRETLARNTTRQRGVVVPVRATWVALAVTAADVAIRQAAPMAVAPLKVTHIRMSYRGPVMEISPW